MPAFEIFIVASLTASHSSGEEPGTLASQLVYLRSLQGEENLSQQETANIAQQLLADMGSGAEPEDISTLFSTDVQFEIPGDIGALPRIGRGIGRVAISDFIRGTRQLLERVRFDVQGIVADRDRAVILGDFVSEGHFKRKNNRITVCFDTHRLSRQDHPLPDVGGQFRSFCGSSIVR